MIQSMFQTPQHCQLHTTEAATHLITAYANTSSQWSTVTVSPYSFTTWRRRLDVKLELLGYNLPATPHLTAGTRKCPLKFPDQLPGKHPPSLPANRLTPSSLKSHCSGGCWLVLGHRVSFTMKLTGFRAPRSSTWSTIEMGRLGLAHVSFSALSPCPRPGQQPLQPPVCRALGLVLGAQGRAQSPCPASRAHREQERPSQQRCWQRLPSEGPREVRAACRESPCHWSLQADRGPPGRETPRFRGTLAGKSPHRACDPSIPGAPRSPGSLSQVCRVPDPTAERLRQEAWCWEGPQV